MGTGKEVSPATPPPLFVAGNPTNNLTSNTEDVIGLIAAWGTDGDNWQGTLHMRHIHDRAEAQRQSAPDSCIYERSWPRCVCQRCLNIAKRLKRPPDRPVDTTTERADDDGR